MKKFQKGIVAVCDNKVHVIKIDSDRCLFIEVLKGFSLFIELVLCLIDSLLMGNNIHILPVGVIPNDKLCDIIEHQQYHQQYIEFTSHEKKCYDQR